MAYPKTSRILHPTRGVNADQPAHEVGEQFYSSVSNVIFRRGFAHRVRGWRDAYVTALAEANPIQILHLLNAFLNDINYWIIVEADGSVWALQGTDATQIDGGLFQATSNPAVYSSTLLNGLPILNNGLDEPAFWSGSGNIATLPGWTATETAKFMVAFNFHAFAMDISGPGGTFNNLVKWSNAAAPGTVPNSWTPGPTTTAGSVELSDGKGPVLCGKQLRDALIIYKQSTAFICQFVGGQNIFAFRPLKRSHGSLNRHSVCDIGEKHFIVEQGDIVISDGVNRQSIGQSRIKDFLFNQLDQNNFERLFCVFHPPTSEVLIAFPSVGSNLANLGIVYNINDTDGDAFGVRDLPNIEHAAVGVVNDVAESGIWDSDAQVWDLDDNPWNSSALTSSSESLVFSRLNDIELQNTLNDVAVSALVSKEDLDFGDAKRVKYIKRLHIIAEPGYGTLFVRLGARMTTNDTIVFGSEFALVEPAQIVDREIQGRFITVQVRSANSEQWVLNSIEIEGELRGYF